MKPFLPSFIIDMWVTSHKYLQIMERNPMSESMTNYEWAPWLWTGHKCLRREPFGFCILCYYFNHKTSGLNTDLSLMQEPTQENLLSGQLWILSS